MVYKSIWQILGIAPTNDITEIKKAYAAKAKKTNPEDDPEGFEALHNAYRNAIRIARASAAARENREAVIQEPAAEKTHEQTPAPAPAEPKAEPRVEPKVEPKAGDRTEKKTEDPKDTPSFDFSNIDATSSAIIRTAKEETDSDTEDKSKHYEMYDFSSVKIPRTNEMEAIRDFKHVHGIETYMQVESLRVMARVSIVKHLTDLYSQYANSTGDVRFWYLYWDEPLVHFFEADPDFREWVLSYVHNPVHRAEVFKITEHLKELPVERKWEFRTPRETKTPAILANRGPARLLIIAPAIFILSILIGMLFHDSLSFKEQVMLSAACTVIYVIFSLLEDLQKKHDKKKKR